MVYEIHYIGASWCSTCKVIKPSTELLAKRFGITLVIKDFDEDLSEEEKDTVSKVPTIRIVEDTKQIVEWNVHQVQSLEGWLQTNITMTVDDLF
jgi:thiol-disulfide isomerase/thioredoxin